jgi:hypothetical protein
VRREGRERAARRPGDADPVPVRMAGQRSTALLSRRLTSISQAHRHAGVESPTTDPLVRRAWRSIRRTHGTASVGKAPARARDVRAMVATLDLDTLIGLRDRALLVVGFAGAFRPSGADAVSDPSYRAPRCRGCRSSGRAQGPRPLPAPAGQQGAAAPDCGGRDRRRVPGAGPGAARVPGVRLRRHRAGLEPRRRSRRRGGRRAGAPRRSDPWEDIVDGRTTERGLWTVDDPDHFGPGKIAMSWPASTT